MNLGAAIIEMTDKARNKQNCLKRVLESVNIEAKEYQQEKKRKRPRKGLERGSRYGGEGMKEGMNHWCHTAQKSDLARTDIVQVD